MFTALAVCRSHGYGVLVSLDDDVLLSPAALAALVAPNGAASAEAALKPLSSGGLGCAMVSPTLSTGIPTVELWAEDFLPPGGPELEALAACFAKAAATPPATWGSLNLSALALPLPAAGGGGGGGGRGWGEWDPARWYASVWAAAAPTRDASDASGQPLAAGLGAGTEAGEHGWLDGPIASSLGAGVHPVRWDGGCTRLAFRAARSRLEDHFGPPAASTAAATPALRLEASGAFPYLCNSAWATTPARLAAALGRADLASFAHPFDEASMSAHFLHGRGGAGTSAPLCVLRGAFGVHPAYGGSSGSGGPIGEGDEEAPGGLEATLHREAAAHLRAALGLGPA